MHAGTRFEALFAAQEEWQVEDALFAYLMTLLPDHPTPPEPRAIPLGVGCRSCGREYPSLQSYVHEHGACPCPALQTWPREGLVGR